MPGRAMTTTLALPRELTIYTVGELHPRWLGWLAELRAADAEGPCAVDAAAVEEADAAGVQLLLSLAHALQREQRALQLLQPSAALAAACNALGLGSLLGGTAGAAT
jgi:ABC-type transporter Mla MlaB component